MIEIKGKLTELFKRPDTEIEIEPSDTLLESMINTPILKDGRIIGIIKKADKDEWSGFLFDTAEVEVSLDMEQIMSVKLKQNF